MQNLILAVVLLWALWVLLAKLAPKFCRALQMRLASGLQRGGLQGVAAWFRPVAPEQGCGSGCGSCATGCNTPAPLSYTPHSSPTANSEQPVRWR